MANPVAMTKSMFLNCETYGLCTFDKVKHELRSQSAMSDVVNKTIVLLPVLENYPSSDRARMKSLFWINWNGYVDHVNLERGFRQMKIYSKTCLSRNLSVISRANFEWESVPGLCVPVIRWLEANLQLQLNYAELKVLTALQLLEDWRNEIDIDSLRLGILSMNDAQRIRSEVARKWKHNINEGIDNFTVNGLWEENENLSKKVRNLRGTLDT